jgi:hypothetical protein
VVPFIVYIHSGLGGLVEFRFNKEITTTTTVEIQELNNVKK